MPEIEILVISYSRLKILPLKSQYIFPMPGESEANNCVLYKILNLRAKEDSFFDFGFAYLLIDWYFCWRYWKLFPL